MSYLISGTGLTKAFVLGIAHAGYITNTPNYDINNITKYGEIYEHPSTGEIAAYQDNWDTLPEIFTQFLVDKEYMDSNDWFPQSEVDEG
jgi:hypothetical protein